MFRLEYITLDSESVCRTQYTICVDKAPERSATVFDQGNVLAENPSSRLRICDLIFQHAERSLGHQMRIFEWAQKTGRTTAGLLLETRHRASQVHAQLWLHVPLQLNQVRRQHLTAFSV